MEIVEHALAIENASSQFKLSQSKGHKGLKLWEKMKSNSNLISISRTKARN